jgi:hypothetical protein
MKKILLLAVLLLPGLTAISQTCTVTGGSTVNWPTNGSGIACAEGGNAVGKTTVVIPSGMTVIFDNGGDTWTGTRIEIFGTMKATANPTVYSSITVMSGGVLHLQGKLAIGEATPDCDYDVKIADGGTVLVDETAADRLVLCGTVLMKGLGACNSCGGTFSGACAWDGNPYCEPIGGFTGPLAYDKNGYNASLPVKLLHFDADGSDNESVLLTWATNVEENFSKFVIQHSSDGIAFEQIGEVAGQGFNIDNIESRYSFIHEAPLLGWNYYRLKAVDLDNSFEYFPVRGARVYGSPKVEVYPNPSAGKEIIYHTNFSPSEWDRVVLLNQFGVEVHNAATSTSGNVISLPELLPAGVYLLRYVSNDVQETVKVLVR